MGSERASQLPGHPLECVQQVLEGYQWDTDKGTGTDGAWNASPMNASLMSASPMNAPPMNAFPIIQRMVIASIFAIIHRFTLNLGD
jgi:hypothetical protein